MGYQLYLLIGKTRLDQISENAVIIMDKRKIEACFDLDSAEYDGMDENILNFEAMNINEILDCLDVDELIDKVGKEIEDDEFDGYLSGEFINEGDSLRMIFSYNIELEDDKFDQFTMFAIEMLKMNDSINNFVEKLNAIVLKLNAKIKKGINIEKKNYMEISI